MSPDELEGDLCEWGDIMEMDVNGLGALGYPSSRTESPGGAGIPVPNYFPKAQINALNRAIQNLESKYKNLLILKYACKLDDQAINKEGLCHYNTVPKWIDKAKHLLVKSKYWKA